MRASWEHLRLEDVLIKQPNKKLVQQGWSPKCHPYPAAAGKWGVLKTTAIQPGRFEPEHNKELPEHLAPKPGIEVKPGDLLITCAGPRSRCGVPALVRASRDRLMMSGKMYRFRPDDRLDSRYLELWLLSPEAQKRIDAMKTGISDSGLNLTHDRFTKLPVPVPSLDEQRRIVDRLEDHLSRLDVGQELLRCNEVRTVSIQEAWLKHTLGDPTPQGNWHRLGEVLESVRGGWSRSARHLVEPSVGVPYLKMNNLTRRGRLDLGEVVYVEADEDALNKYGVCPGDVLFNSKNSGDLIGKTALADPRTTGAVINENIMRLRFDARVSPEFGAMWFLGPQMRSRILGAASASTNVAAVYQKDLVTFPMWVPAPEEQSRLVAEFEGVREAAERMQVEGAAARRRGDLLRRAILATAFAGQLTGKVDDLDRIEEAVG